MAIPKKIHYVWLGDAPIPKRDAEFIENWKKLNPDFEVRHWTEKDINLDRFPIVKKALAEKRWALAADVIRMYAIYTEGGFYFDTDVELLKPLKPLLKYNAVAGWESQYWFTTAAFGAKKHSPWIKKILSRYEDATARGLITTDSFMETVHSPSIYAKDIFGLELDGKTRVYGDNDLAVFGYDYFRPQHYISKEINVTENTILFHHYASTWHHSWQRLQNFFVLLAYRVLGQKIYGLFERSYNKRIERKIRRQLP